MCCKASVSTVWHRHTFITELPLSNFLLNEFTDDHKRVFLASVMSEVGVGP